MTDDHNVISTMNTSPRRHKRRGLCAFPGAAIVPAGRARAVLDFPTLTLGPGVAGKGVVRRAVGEQFPLSVRDDRC